MFFINSGPSRVLTKIISPNVFLKTVRSAPVSLSNASSVSVKEINVPEGLTLRTGLTPKQIKAAVEMHTKQLKLPAHFLPKPAFTVPKHGAVPELSVALRKCGGRNHHGRITVRHRGGGFKRRIRILDTKRLDQGPWTVLRIEHDPNRSAKLALLKSGEDNDARYCYVLAAEGMSPGQSITNSIAVEQPTPGSSMRLADIPMGTSVHSVELRPGAGGVICRTAGSKAIVMSKDETHALVKLPSGLQRRIPLASRASLGIVGNGAAWGSRVLGTAGANRRLGRRPSVRGVAMNAVDHPNGGGKGGRGKGKHPKSPWGWLVR